jgi:large subunit ribosomal protein L25
MKTIELSVEKRSTTGKNEARRDRVAGRIPAVVYGAGKANVPISVNRKSLADVFREGAGENAIFLLKLAGSDQSRHAMIKEMQRDPVSRKPLHIDFVRVALEKLRPAA